MLERMQNCKDGMECNRDEKLCQAYSEISKELKISVSNFQQLGLLCELTNDPELARRVITLVEEGDFSD